MAATTEQHGPQGPSVEYEAFLARWDHRHHVEDEVSEREQEWREQGRLHQWHRGQSSHGDGSSDRLPWSVSTDVVTTTPRRAGHKALHHWIVEGENRARAERRSGILRAMEEQGLDPALPILSDDHDIEADLANARVRHRNRVLV